MSQLLKVGLSLSILSRKTKPAGILKGELVNDEFKGKSKAARRINRALQLLSNGEPRDASKLIQAELARIVLGDEAVASNAWEEKKIPKSLLRRAVFKVLRDASTGVQGETWNGWVKRTKAIVIEAATTVGWSDDGSLSSAYMACKEQGNSIRGELGKAQSAVDWEVVSTISTVHKVKGAEFDTVILYVPKPEVGKCPSIEWWPGASDGEERRIAYVAVSRAKNRFVLCLHKTVFEALETTRPNFVACFEPPVYLPPSVPCLFDGY